jgi:hypothetical protein
MPKPTEYSLNSPLGVDDISRVLKSAEASLDAFEAHLLDEGGGGEMVMEGELPALGALPGMRLTDMSIRGSLRSIAAKLIFQCRPRS